MHLTASMVLFFVSKSVAEHALNQLLQPVVRNAADNSERDHEHDNIGNHDQRPRINFVHPVFILGRISELNVPFKP